MRFSRFFGIVTPESRVLEHAAELLEERGWTQNQWKNDYGAMCALEVLSESIRHHCPLEDFVSMRSKAENVMRRLTKGESLIAWNDYPLRTKEEVIQTFRKAAHRC